MTDVALDSFDMLDFNIYTIFEDRFCYFGYFSNYPQDLCRCEKKEERPIPYSTNTVFDQYRIRPNYCTTRLFLSSVLGKF